MKSNNDSKSNIKISVIVNKTLHNKIKLFASHNNLNISALLIAAAKKYMSKA